MPSIADLKTDQERAAAIREALRFSLAKACDVLNQAEAIGLAVHFDVGQDDTGRVVIRKIDVARKL